MLYRGCDGRIMRSEVDLCTSIRREIIQEPDWASPAIADLFEERRMECHHTRFGGSNLMATL